MGTSLRRVAFVHGVGHAGEAAWPSQRRLGPAWDLRFIQRVGYGPTEDPCPTDFEGDAARVLDAVDDGGHVVAHSYGAIAALMAVRERPALVASLVLFEPACLSLARGGPEVEAHIGAMAPVFRQADALEDLAFEAAFFAALGAPQTNELPTPERRLCARRLRLQAEPWEAPLEMIGLSLPPTLVVTGGWSELYEEVAQVLVSSGARHVTVADGHRPQDAPEANGLMTDFWGSVSMD